MSASHFSPHCALVVVAKHFYRTAEQNIEYPERDEFETREFADAVNGRESKVERPLPNTAEMLEHADIRLIRQGD